MSLQVVSTVRRDNLQFFTKIRFSALFWLTRTSPGANWHIEGRVCLQRVTKFLTFYLDHHVSMHCVDYETCSCACSRTKKTYLHTFRIRKTCTCVTFNTWHPICHIISHRCTWNEIQPHDFILTNPSLLATIDIWNRVWVHCLTNTTDCEACSLCKLDTTLHNVLTYRVMPVCKYSHTVCVQCVVT